MDSISRSALLSLLRSQTMTQEEIIKLIENMQPREVDTTQGERRWSINDQFMLDLGVSPDLLGWPAGILAGLG